MMALTLSALARFPKVSQVELRLFLVDELAGLSSGKSSLGSGGLAAGFFGNGTAGRGAVGGELAGAQILGGNCVLTVFQIPFLVCLSQARPPSLRQPCAQEPSTLVAAEKTDSLPSLGQSTCGGF